MPRLFLGLNVSIFANLSACRCVEYPALYSFVLHETFPCLSMLNTRLTLMLLENGQKGCEGSEKKVDALGI